MDMHKSLQEEVEHLGIFYSFLKPERGERGGNYEYICKILHSLYRNVNKIFGGLGGGERKDLKNKNL